MFKATRLVTFRDGIDVGEKQRAVERFDALVTAVPGSILARNRPSLEGSVNGGEIVSHLVFADEAAWREARNSNAWHALEDFCLSGEVKRCDWVVYQQEAHGIREPGIENGVHRILLLSVRPFTSMGKVAKFEAEMRDMPNYLPSILNWGLSHVVESGGERHWTHVWEQDFADAGGLFGSYMMHPIHFAHIDRWFDTQSHDWIVDPELCSTYCTFERSALALRS